MRNEIELSNGTTSLTLSDNRGIGYTLQDATLSWYKEKGNIGVFIAAAGFNWEDYQTTEIYLGLSLLFLFYFRKLRPKALGLPTSPMPMAPQSSQS